MIEAAEKAKTQKLTKMSREEYKDMMLGKLNDLDEFMKPENHRRWFRNGNPELTSSLIRSQINMIRNALGGVIQK